MKKYSIAILLMLCCVLSYGKSGRAVLLGLRTDPSISESHIDLIQDALHASLLSANRFTMPDRVSANRKGREKSAVVPACSDKKCMIETGRKMGVDFVVGGSISSVYDTIACSIVLIEVAAEEILSQTSREFIGSIHEFVQFQVPSLIKELLNAAELVHPKDSGDAQRKKIGISSAEYSSLARAYGLYLAMELDSALVYYIRAREAMPQNIDPYYGLVNCYTALRRYDEALRVGMEAPGADKDFYMLQKLAEVQALRNSEEGAMQYYESALTMARVKGDIPEYQIADLTFSVGNGFLKRNNFREAQAWFEKGLSMESGKKQCQAALERVRVARKESLRQQVNVSAGMLAYSHGSPFRDGSFYTVLTSLLLRHSSLMTVGFSVLSIIAQSDSSMQGIPAKIPPGQGKDTVSEDALVQRDLYASYTNFYSIIQNTRLQIGSRLSQSNMEYSEFSYTGFLGHLSHFGAINLGSSWYYSALPNHAVLQVSPRLGLRVKSGKAEFDFEGMPHIIKGVELDNADAPSGDAPPLNLQLSGDLSGSAAIPHLRVKTTVSVGPRAYLNDDDAQVLLNTSEPFMFGSKVLTEYSPFRFPLVIYYLYRFSYYESYRSHAHLAGVFLQW